MNLINLIKVGSFESVMSGGSVIFDGFHCTFWIGLKSKLSCIKTKYNFDRIIKSNRIVLYHHRQYFLSDFKERYILSCKAWVGCTVKVIKTQLYVKVYILRSQKVFSVINKSELDSSSWNYEINLKILYIKKLCVNLVKNYLELNNSNSINLYKMRYSLDSYLICSKLEIFNF
jgi:hypothetical protein